MHAHGLHACIDVESNILAWCARAQIAHLLPKRTSLGVRDRHVVSFRQDNLRVIATYIQQATRRGNRSVRQSVCHGTYDITTRTGTTRARAQNPNERAPATTGTMYGRRVSVASDPARLSRPPARARSQALRPNPKPAESGRRCGSGESSPGTDVAGVSPVPCACRRGSEGARPTDAYVSERMHTLRMN